MVLFSMTLKDRNPDFMQLFDAEYFRNGTRYKHGILIGTYACPTQRYHFEWSWV